MKKKLLGLLISLLCLMMIVSAFPAYAEIAGSYTYSVYSKKMADGNYVKYAHITQYTGSESNVTIPDTMGGLPVWSIGLSAFSNNTNLKSVVVPEGVEEIGVSVFYGCTNLTDVSLPDSLLYIGGSTFDRCTALESIVIPDSVVELGGGLFNRCENLVDITLSKNLTVIGYDIFNRTPYYDDEANWNNGMLYYDKYLISSDSSIEGSRSVKSGTTLIAADAFGSTKLTSVTFPESIKYICNGAFSYASNLKSVNLPSNLIYLGNGAFNHCESLDSIAIPASITTVNMNTFNGCTNLSSVTLPATLTEIGDTAFRDCESLTSVSLPASLKTIGMSAFENCGFSSVAIPANVEKVGTLAFAYCNNLSGFTVNGNNQKLYVKDNVLYSSEGTLLCYPTAKAGDTFYLPENVKDIKQYAFSGNSYLKNIYLHKDVSSYISDFVFYDAYALENIFINGEHELYKAVDGVLYQGTILKTYPQGKKDAKYTTLAGTSEIRGYAFYGNPNIKEITISEGVEKMSSSTFDHCDNLKVVSIPSTVTALSTTFAYACPELSVINFNSTVEKWESFRAGFDSQSRDGLYIYCTDGTVEALPPRPIYSLGDTNLDGKVNIKDATTIQKYAASLVEFSEDALMVADVTGDEKVNVKDATAIQKYVAGIISALGK